MRAFAQTIAGIGRCLVAANDLTMDGYDSPNESGLRIKPDTSRGGSVSVSGALGNATPVDCSAAFVPLKSVLPESPI